MRAQGSWSSPFNHEQGPSANATDPLVPFGGAANQNITYYAFAGKTYSWPVPASNGTVFKAAHMALIPKGPYQGMVLVWNDEPVLARAPGYGPVNLTATEYWSCQAYSIIDPAPVPVGPRFRNFLLPIAVVTPANPASASDEAANLFCSGHAWSPYGDLIVTGGTIWAPSQGNLLGPKLTYAWNPKLSVGGWTNSTPTPVLYPNDFGLWLRGPDLRRDRWYPTNVLTGKLTRLTPPREVMMVLGGSNQVFGGVAANPSWNEYEALRIDGPSAPGIANFSTDVVNGVDWWPGPGTYTAGVANVEEDWLENYPRCHLLSDGRVLFTGYAPRWARVDHDGSPGIWDQQAGAPPYSATNWQHPRHDDTSVLFPNIGGIKDVVVRFGGADGIWAGSAPNGTTDTVEAWFPNAPPASPSWLAQASMPNPQPGMLPNGRYLMNIVILPDASLLVVGGAARYPNGPDIPLIEPLLYDGSWSVVSALPMSAHDYHSAAVLLPDGRVFVGGGESRSWDYEIYSPAYLSIDPDLRPRNPQLSASVAFNPSFDAYELDYGESYEIRCDELPLGVSIDKVVLMAPGSTTHHSDMSMRYHEMAVTPGASSNSVKFTAPPDEYHAPRGIYMLFLTASNGSISPALWVWMQ